MTFEPNKNSKELGIDTTRKFVVVNSYGGNYGGNFEKGDIVKLITDDNTESSYFERLSDNKKSYLYWKWLAYADENIIVKCPTQEKWDKVVQKALDSGKRWFGSDKSLNSDYWRNRKGESIIHIENDTLTYDDYSYAKQEYPNYTFLEAEEYLGEEKKEKPKFKVGDKVRIKDTENVRDYKAEKSIGLSFVLDKYQAEDLNKGRTICPFNNEYICNYRVDDFELIEEHKPKIENKQFNQPKHKFMGLIKNLFKSKENQAKEGLGLSDGNGGLNDYGRVEWADFLYKKLEKEREEFDALLVEKWEEGKKK